ncbi:MAG: acetyltransferase [Actinomycetota bacterium]|nr:acetyltransferase [Actinomycetota bacterium]
MTGCPRALVVLGAGGHGREMIDAILAANMVRDQWRLLGVLDDDESVVPRLRALGVRWLGALSSLPELDAQYVIGIGSNQIRQQINDVATATGMQAATVVHPSSSIGMANQLADGVYLAAHSTVTTNVVLGRHAHVNVGASVAHDCTVGAYANLSPGARLGGHVALGNGVFMGINSSVLPRCRVGEWAVIGAGATVVADIGARIVCVGTPARPRGGREHPVGQASGAVNRLCSDSMRDVS